MSVTEKFITSFKNLNGTTIGERRKNLFLLLNSNKSNANELDFTLLHPQNFLEEKFKVDVLLYFRRIPDLLDTLKSEKRLLINRILRRNAWFIEQVLCNLNGNELIAIFPLISFSTKVKIINKLAKFLNDTDKARDCFEAIKNKYGLYLAAKILPSCGSDFILEFITTHRFKPSSKQVLTIISRYPEITENLLDFLTQKYDICEEYDIIFKHVGKCDFELYIKMIEKHHFRKCLGWRLTDKFVRLNKNRVIAAPQEYYWFLHNRQIAKTLNRDFNLMYVKFFPQAIEEFSESYQTIFSVLQKLPKRMNGVYLLLNTFQNMYGVSLWTYPSFINLELLNILPLEDRKERVSIETKPESIDELQWIPYLTTDKSLPYIKHKISLSSVAKSRARLVESLVLTCKLNCDLGALLDVSSYLLSKHRNDNVVVREGFLRSLIDQFELEKLSEQHWIIINQVLDISYLNNEKFGAASKIKEAYIHYRLLQNLPVKDQLLDWIQSEYKNLIIIKKNTQLSKYCLLMFAEIIDELSDASIKSWGCILISALIDWNKCQLNEYISVYKFQNVLNSIKQNFKCDDYSHKDINILNYCIQKGQEERNKYFDIYLSLSTYYGNINILHWLIQYDPFLVMQNIDKITAILLENYGNYSQFFFFKYGRNFAHLDMPNRIISTCLNDFKQNQNGKSLIAMTYLQDPLEFVKFVSQYYPTEKEANYKTEEGRKQYASLEVVGKYLKDLSPPSAALDSILIFCKGDFLKLIRSSLYSISDNVNEIKLVPFLSELINRAVSTRKHAMHLTFRVLDKLQVYKIIKHFMEKEKNPSLRKFIFKICFNFFVMNPEDFTWELVTLNLNAVDIDDEEAVEILLQIDKIPQDYIVKYILLTWNVLHTLPDPDNKRQTQKTRVLQSISNNLISQMPHDFCENVISLYFLKDNSSLTHFASIVNTFVCKYIIYCSDDIEQKKRLNSCFALVKDFITKNWGDPKYRTSSRNVAIDFLKEFCGPFLKNECHNKVIFTDFVIMWNSFLKPEETFNEYLHLTFTHFIIDSYQMDELASKLEELCNVLVNKYSQVIIGMLCNKINFFSRYFFKNDEEFGPLALIDSIIHDGTSVACLMLAISLLNKVRPSGLNTSTINKYNEIIEKLDKYSDPVVRLYLCSHLVQNHN